MFSCLADKKKGANFDAKHVLAVSSVVAVPSQANGEETRDSQNVASCLVKHGGKLITLKIV